MAHAMEITPDARTPCTCTCMALSTHHFAGTARNDHAAGSHAISSWIRSSALPLARMHCRAPVTVCLSIVRPFCGSGRVWKWYRAREWLALRDSGSSETACGGACHLGGGAASRVRKVVVSGRGMVRVLLSVPPNWAIYHTLAVLTTGSYFYPRAVSTLLRSSFLRRMFRHRPGVCLLMLLLFLLSCCRKHKAI